MTDPDKLPALHASFEKRYKLKSHAAVGRRLDWLVGRPVEN